MADELAVNGGGADVDVEIASKEYDSDGNMNQTIEKLMQKLVILEQQKKQLVDDTNSAAEKIKQLEDAILSSESDKRALSSIAARAAELETEVSRLQHDLISSMSEGQESNAELAELKRVVEELKKSESEKTEKIDVIDKERKLLLDRLNQVSDRLKESENQIRELEKKIEVFEMERNQKLKAEEDAASKIREKDEQIANLNRLIDELKSEVVKNRADNELSKKEKEEVEIGKKELESKIDELQKELESYQKINSALKEKAVENTNGIAGDCDEKMKSLKPDWPVIAATAGAVAMVAVVYFRHAKF
ncbi:hypothetical protein QVD17_39706 [Tagetes erecta]|uniref:Uncharacterized protein n=1 Tax=Tagetes erecta TaxID=13708 RepID=A0AAD8JRA0_TARER|nr:hypothetical protein QVD17_39706 [Tagetes erecta]